MKYTAHTTRFNRLTYLLGALFLSTQLSGCRDKQEDQETVEDRTIESEPDQMMLVESGDDQLVDGPDADLMFTVPSFNGSDEAENLDPIGKIDFLFVVDNSVSMNDKQELLEKAVPGMIEALVSPPCFDTDGIEQEAAESGECPDGSERPYAPLTDIHIGIITTSLGAPGREFCSSTRQNQQGRLLSTIQFNDEQDEATAEEPPAFLS